MNVRVSPSSINLFFDCKRCFWLKHREDLERPYPYFPSLPSGIDRELKNHFERMRNRSKKPPEIENMAIDLKPVENRELLEKARDWRKQPKWRDEESCAVLVGAMDELAETETGEKVVVDFKTRGRKPGERAPNYQRTQLALYRLMLEENGYRTHEKGLILYYYPDRFQDGSFRLSSEARLVNLEKLKPRKWVRDAVKTLERDEPEMDTNCDYCEWTLSQSSTGMNTV